MAQMSSRPRQDTRSTPEADAGSDSRFEPQRPDGGNGPVGPASDNGEHLVAEETLPATVGAFDSSNDGQSAADPIDDLALQVPPKLQDTFLDERDDVLSVINELEDQLDRHQVVREALEREAREGVERLQIANQRIQELEWQHVTLQTRVDALEQVRDDLARLEDEVAEANARAQRIADELGRSEKENARLKSELRATNKQLEESWALRKERDGLRAEMKSLGGKLDVLERSNRELLDERGTLLSQIQEARITLEESRTQRHQMEITVRAAQDRTHEIQQVQEALADKLETLRAEKKNLLAQITHLERENARLVEQSLYYDRELGSLRSSNRNAEASLASIKKAFAEVRVALGETKSRVRRRNLEALPRINATLGKNQPPTDPAPAPNDTDK